VPQFEIWPLDGGVESSPGFLYAWRKAWEVRMGKSLIETICEGGCYWKRERADSPGHSIAIPAETPFRIAIEGPQSHQYIAGMCRDGYYLVEEGPHAGRRFNSANEAVNTVRDPSSNAFLYIHFRIASHWILADDLRRSPHSLLDEAEEAALEIAQDKIRRHPKGKQLEPVEAMGKAAQIVAKRPEFMEEARRRLAVLSGIDVSSFDWK
jgi:hypothetical protein